MLESHLMVMELADLRMELDFKVKLPSLLILKLCPMADSPQLYNLEEVHHRLADNPHRQPAPQGHKHRARQDLVMKLMMVVVRWRRREEERQWQERRDQQQLDLAMVMMPDFEMAMSTQLIGATLAASTRSSTTRL